MIQWESKPIRNLGRVVTGKTPPKDNSEYFENGEELFVSPKDLDWNQFYVTETETVITKKALEKFKNQVLPKNAVMFTSLSFAFGKMGITSQKCLTNQQINSIIVNDKHDYKFVYYLLQTYRPIIFSYNSGIDTPIVPKSVFEGIEVKCPPLDIQQKIAAILSSYDDLIKNNQRRIALLEKMAEEIYREWFVRFRFPGYQSAEFEKGIPKGWTLERVDSLGKVITGKTPSTEIQKYYGGNIPFVKTPDMHGNMFIYETEEKLTTEGLNSQPSQIIPANAISVSCIGTGGIVSIVTEKCSTNQQINSTVLRNSKDLEWGFFTIKGLKETIQAFGSTGTTMTNLSKGKFAGLKVIMPPKEIREDFHEKIFPLFEQIKALSLTNMNLKKTRNQLLPRLISGKLSVENLDIQFPPSMCEECTA